MAAYAGSGLSCHEELVGGRAVYVMAGLAAFTHGVVFEDEGTSELGVAREAALVVACHHLSSRCQYVATMQVVAVGAAHPAFHDGMPMLEQKLALNVEVTGEAALGAATYNRAPQAILDVQASGSMAAFARLDNARVRLCFARFDRHAPMIGVIEVAVFRLVAFNASLVADKGRIGYGSKRLVVSRLMQGEPLAAAYDYSHADEQVKSEAFRAELLREEVQRVDPFHGLFVLSKIGACVSEGRGGAG